jgi:EAL domain-containing protein (putative c-di-GMP-specific phosphodiesterase class I)
LDHLVLLADVRDALSTTDQFMLYLQPTVDLRTGLPVGAEASVYWRHPRRGLLAPEEFIGTVEQSDMAAGFSRYTVELAVAAAARWAEAGLDLPIAVNLCARCTVDPDMPEMVAGILARYGVPPHRLVVEVTEGVMESEIGPVDQVITGLREAGVRVSVDDFGTASASWSFLTRFMVDYVKIDRSFVVAMVELPQARAIVRTTVDPRSRSRMRGSPTAERADQRDALLSEEPTRRGSGVHPPPPAARRSADGATAGRTAPIG